jgi:hypothetical protein
LTLRTLHLNGGQRAAYAPATLSLLRAQPILTARKGDDMKTRIVQEATPFHWHPNSTVAASECEISKSLADEGSCIEVSDFSKDSKDVDGSSETYERASLCNSVFQ